MENVSDSTATTTTTTNSNINSNSSENSVTLNGIAVLKGEPVEIKRGDVFAVTNLRFRFELDDVDGGTGVVGVMPRLKQKVGGAVVVSFCVVCLCF